MPQQGKKTDVVFVRNGITSPQLDPNATMVPLAFHSSRLPPSQASQRACWKNRRLHDSPAAHVPTARERLPTSLRINDVLEVKRYHVLFRLRFTISQLVASSDLTTEACRETRTHPHTPHNRVARAKKRIFSRSWNRQAAHGRRQGKSLHGHDLLIASVGCHTRRGAETAKRVRIKIAIPPHK